MSDYYTKNSECSVVRTSVWTMSGRCMRKSWTTPYTSTTFSLSIWKMRRSMAMKVPVRPTPALKGRHNERCTFTRHGNMLTHLNIGSDTRWQLSITVFGQKALYSAYMVSHIALQKRNEKGSTVFSMSVSQFWGSVFFPKKNPIYDTKMFSSLCHSEFIISWI